MTNHLYSKLWAKFIISPIL